jgi:hypothetical protein
LNVLNRAERSGFCFCIPFVPNTWPATTQDAPCAVASAGGVTGDVYPSAMSFLAQTANRVVDEAKSAKRGGKLRG